MTIGDYWAMFRGWLFITGVKILAIALGVTLTHTSVGPEEEPPATEEHPE